MAVHTARVKMLLEVFPRARFIYIHRNPYEVCIPLFFTSDEFDYMDAFTY